MKLIKNIIHRAACLLSVSVAAGMALTGCDSLIYDYEGDCDIKVRFVFDRHLHQSDAFAYEVNAVTLYVIDDATGQVVWEKSESGEALKSGHYRMSVPDDLPDGSYSMIAWCGEGVGEHFTVADHTLYSDLRCHLERDREEADGRAFVDADIKRLYHGRLDNVEIIKDTDSREYTIYLTKDTNDINIILQHLSGEPVDPDDFTFSITDTNGHLEWDNSLLDDEMMEYRPHHLSVGTATMNPPFGAPEQLKALMPASRTQTTQSICLAEHTVGRMVKGQDMLVNIVNAEGDTTVRIPMIDYALLTKGSHYADMDDQEYLDRQDKYDLTFFLDESDRWVAVEIKVLSWSVVRWNTDL